MRIKTAHWKAFKLRNDDTVKSEEVFFSIVLKEKTTFQNNRKKQNLR